MCGTGRPAGPAAVPVAAGREGLAPGGVARAVRARRCPAPLAIRQSRARSLKSDSEIGLGWLRLHGASASRFASSTMIILAGARRGGGGGKGANGRSAPLADSAPRVRQRTRFSASPPLFLPRPAGTSLPVWSPRRLVSGGCGLAGARRTDEISTGGSWIEPSIWFDPRWFAKRLGFTLAVRWPPCSQNIPESANQNVSYF